jgi:hypothetical protein
MLFVFLLAPSVADVQAAIEYIYPLVYEFKKERTKADLIALELKRRGKKRKRDNFRYNQIPEPDLIVAPILASSDEEDSASDKSWE